MRTAAAAGREDILQALRDVHDPELHRSIVDLGMVTGVELRHGRARVSIKLTVAGCPLKAEIQRRIVFRWGVRCEGPDGGTLRDLPTPALIAGRAPAELAAMGSRGRAHFQTNFTVERMCEDTLKIYRALIEGRQKS